MSMWIVARAATAKSSSSVPPVSEAKGKSPPSRPLPPELSGSTQFIMLGLLSVMVPMPLPTAASAAAMLVSVPLPETSRALAPVAGGAGARSAVSGAVCGV